MCAIGVWFYLQYDSKYQLDIQYCVSYHGGLVLVFLSVFLQVYPHFVAIFLAKMLSSSAHIQATLLLISIQHWSPPSEHGGEHKMHFWYLPSLSKLFPTPLSLHFI